MIALMCPVLVFTSAGHDWRHDTGVKSSSVWVSVAILVLFWREFILLDNSHLWMTLFPFSKGGIGLTSLIKAPEFRCLLTSASTWVKHLCHLRCPEISHLPSAFVSEGLTSPVDPVAYLPVPWGWTRVCPPLTLNNFFFDSLQLLPHDGE